MNTSTRSLRPAQPAAALQSVPYVATLEVAVEAAQALARAEGAALFLAVDDDLIPAVTNVDPRRLEVAFGVCRGVLQGRPIAMFCHGGQEAFIAMPLVHGGLLAGVLYFEGLAPLAGRRHAPVERCAATIARMLALARLDVTIEVSSALA